MTDGIESNKPSNQIKVRATMEKCYVYDTFEKGKYDFTSPLHIRSLVRQKDGFQ